MNWVVSFLKSSIGAKAVVALTGVALVGFVVQHMLGNLQLFAGAEQFNSYAHTLKSLGPLLWIARLGLLGLFGLHIGMALRVQKMNRAARGATPYMGGGRKSQASTVASRSMLLGGLMLLLFVLFHLSHYTLGFTNAEFLTFVDAQGRHDAYKMTVLGFSSKITVGFYIGAMGVLAFHLGHGVSSMFQTLGLNHPRYRPMIKGFGPILGTVVFLGFTSIPIAVQLGIITLQGGVAS